VEEDPKPWLLYNSTNQYPLSSEEELHTTDMD